MVGATDPRGSGYVVAKMYTGTQPGVAPLWHLASHCDRWDLLPAARWVPREDNTWADQLTHGDFTGFTLALRRRVNNCLFEQLQSTWRSMAGLSDEAEPGIRDEPPYRSTKGGCCAPPWSVDSPLAWLFRVQARF